MNFSQRTKRKIKLLKQVISAFLSGLVLVIIFSYNYASEHEASSAESIDSFGSGQFDRSRLLVLTDIGGDPDDQQSLIRLLVYSNEFDIEGIVVEGWKKYSGYEQMGVAASVLTGYGKVRDNLVKHKSGYPTEEYLKGVLKRGAVDVVKPEGNWQDYVGEGKDTEGSKHIVTVLEKDESTGY
jgi:hypothetical protein